MLDCTMVFMLNAALKIHDEESESLTWNIYITPKVFSLLSDACSPLYY